MNLVLGVFKIFDKFFKQRKRYFSKRPKDDLNPKDTIKPIDSMKPKEAVLDTKNDLNSIKSELDEHLETINANTSEIQTSYQYINEISDKVEKIAERLEHIELFLQEKSNFNLEKKSFSIKPLTKTEQHVFMVIYALEDEKGLVSYADISKKTGLTPYLANEYIARLMGKGIPIIKKYINNIPFIQLNHEFKRLQAMENILMIDTAQKELFNF